MQNLYIASSVRFVEQCEEIADLATSGAFPWTITRRWWDEYVRNKYDHLSHAEFHALPHIQAVMRADFDAVRRADVVVVYSNYHKQSGKDWDTPHPTDKIGIHRIPRSVGLKERLENYIENYTTPSYTNPTEDDIEKHGIDKVDEVINPDYAQHFKDMQLLYELIWGEYAPLTGALVEAGAGLYAGKTVIIYGHIKRSAMVSGAIHLEHTEGHRNLLSLLETLRGV